MKILLVEDEPELAEAVADLLREERYAVDVAPDGETASEQMAFNDYDGVVLDYNIPPPDGVELLREWRSQGLAVPVLMLTARSAVDDRVTGLDAGADDYLTKPFDFAELLARVRSLLRRRVRPLAPPLEAGDLIMDRSARRVEVAGEGVDLSPKEFGLLEYLLRHKDEVVTRTQIEEHVWDSSFDSMTNVVDVLIHRLRRKLDHGRSGRLIHTVKGVGYTLKGRRS